jgi:hypothetical protein
MEQLIIQVDSQDTSAAIKQFVSRFEDATIEGLVMNDDDYYQQNYGMKKAAFENELNIGVAQNILGINKPWEEVKTQLLQKIKDANKKG